jgi:hypothetical protein
VTELHHCGRHRIPRLEVQCAQILSHRIVLSHHDAPAARLNHEHKALELDRAARVANVLGGEEIYHAIVKKVVICSRKMAKLSHKIKITTIKFLKNHN